jgi:hypothetical protein
MIGSKNLQAPLAKEHQAPGALERKVENSFRRRPDEQRCVMDRHSVGAGDFTEAVCEEAPRRAHEARWDEGAENLTLIPKRP